MRTLLTDPRLLILDEATASIDTETAFIIAHRLSTVKHADRIIGFDQGRVAESGTHEDLLAQRGLYYRFYAMTYASLEVEPKKAAM